MQPSKSGLLEQIFRYHTICTARGCTQPETMLLPLKLHTATVHMLGYCCMLSHTSSSAGCAVCIHMHATLCGETGCCQGQVPSRAGRNVLDSHSTPQVLSLYVPSPVLSVSMQALLCGACQLSKNHPSAARFDLVNISTGSAVLTARRACLNPYADGTV